METLEELLLFNIDNMTLKLIKNPTFKTNKQKFYFLQIK